MVIEEVVVFTKSVELSQGVSNDDLLLAVEDQEFVVWSESRLVLASDSSVLSPEVGVSLNDLRLVLVEN